MRCARMRRLDRFVTQDYLWPLALTITLASGFGLLAAGADAAVVFSTDDRAAWTAAAGGGLPDYVEDFAGISPMELFWIRLSLAD